MLLGEAEGTLPELVAAIRDEPDHAALLAGLAARPGFYVPSLHGARLPAIAAAADAILPAYSQIRTPHTELRAMFLIEPGRGGYRTLTTAADGASERMRDVIQRKTKERHLLAAAALCRAHGMKQLKLYMMLGLPGETSDDIDELARFSLELSRVAPRLVLGIAPFVA